MGVRGGPPFEGKPGDVAQLDGPGDGVSGDGELVVENGALVHVLFFSSF